MDGQETGVHALHEITVNTWSNVKTHHDLPAAILRMSMSNASPHNSTDQLPLLCLVPDLAAGAIMIMWAPGHTSVHDWLQMKLFKHSLFVLPLILSHAIVKVSSLSG